MPRRPRRKRVILSQAIACEAMERRMLLSLSPLGTEFRANLVTAGSQSTPAVAGDADGDFVVVWQDPNLDTSSDSIWMQRYSSSGAGGGQLRVNTFTPGAQRNAAVAMDIDGDFVVVWQSAAQDGDGDGVYAQRFSATSQPQGPEFRVNTTTTGNQNFPGVAMDADGDFVVVWMSAGGVFAQRYDALGNASGPEFQVDAVTPSGALFPAVAMDADGDFVVAWNKYGQDGSYNGVYARRFSAAGSPDGDEFRVNTFTTGDQDFPAVAMDPAGNTVITWESSGQDGSGSGIYAQRYNAAGAPQGGEFRVNFTTSAGQAAPSVSMDLDGDFMVAWSSTDFSGSYGIFAQAYNSAGAVQVPEFRANTFSTGNQHLASVALDHEGDVVVVWQSGGQDGSGEGIFGQQYDESPDTAPPAVSDVLAIGQPVSSGERILQNPSTLSLLFTEAMSTTGGSSGANSVTNPANYTLMRNGVVVSSLIASVTFGLNDRKHEAVLNMTEPLLDGNYVLTASQALHDVAGNPLDGDGNGVLGGDFARSFGIFPPGAIGREFRVNTVTEFDQSKAVVSSDAAGNYVVAWETTGDPGGASYDVVAQRFNADGQPQGDQFLVNTYTTHNQFNPAISLDADGDFVIAWNSFGQDGSGYGIFAQRFNAAGTPQGAEIAVNMITTGAQFEPEVACAPGGEFVITWQNSQDSDVAARRYSAQGAPLGNEFRVNSTTSSIQDLPSVAMSAGGSFVIAWQGPGGGTVAHEIFAQRFDRFGAPLGAELRVNSLGTTDQNRPSVASDAAGNFVIAWESDGQDGSGLGIFARRYSAVGVPGTEFRVNSLTTDHQFGPSVAMDADGDFVVAWQDPIRDGSSTGIFARRFNAAAQAQTPDFAVNTFTPLAQAEPGIAMDSQGNFVVAWDSQQQDGFGRGVYAQRFGPAYGVSSSDFVFENAPQRLRFTFDEDVASSIGTNDIVLQNLTTQSTIPSNHLSLLYDQPTRTAFFTYVGPGGLVANVLPDGNYRATIAAAGIVNALGVPFMVGDHVFDFFFLNGDANRDGRVTLQDFNRLAANFGLQSGVTFSMADFNYDGRVTLPDFNILAGRFGAALGEVFGQSSIEQSGPSDDLRRLLKELT